MRFLRTKFFVASMVSLAMLIAAGQASAIPLTFVDGGGDDQSFSTQITASGGVTVNGQITFQLRGSISVVAPGINAVGTINIAPQFSPVSLGTIVIDRNPTGTGTLTLSPQTLQNAVVSSVSADLMGGLPVSFTSSPFTFTGDGNVVNLPLLLAIFGSDIDASVSATLSGTVADLAFQQTGSNMFTPPGTVTPGPIPNNYSVNYDPLDLAGSEGFLSGTLNGTVDGSANLSIGSLISFDFNLPGIATINESLNELLPGLPGAGSVQDLEPGVFGGAGRDIRTTINPAVPVGLPLAFNFAASSATVLTSVTTVANGSDIFTAWVSGSLTFNLGVDLNVDGLNIQLQDSTADALEVPVLVSNVPDGGTLQFGNVLVGTGQIMPWTVSNNGSDGSLITGSLPNSVGGEFGTPPIPTPQNFSLGQGQSSTRNYQYRPTNLGTDSVNRTLNITNNTPVDNPPFTVTFQGTGVAPVQSVTKTDSPLTRIGTTSINPASITITNIGNGNLDTDVPLSQSNLNGSINTGTNARFVGGGGPAFSLNDGAATSYGIAFTPLTHSVQSSTFTVAFTNGNSAGTNTAQNVQVVINGQGVGPIFNGLPYDTNNNPAPGTVLDFGDVVIGNTGTLQLDISNITTDPNGGDSTLTDLTLLSATITGPNAAEFQLNGFVPGTVLNAGDLISYLVDFIPGFPPGAKTATLTFLTDQDAPFGQAGTSFSFTLNGLAAPEPASVLGFALCTIGGVVGYRLRRRR